MIFNEMDINMFKLEVMYTKLVKLKDNLPMGLKQNE